MEHQFYFVYILKSLVDGKNYAGFTTNLELRFQAHCEGRVKSTAHKRPFALIYYEACLNESDALHREKYLKSFHVKIFLKNRLKSNLTG